MAKQTNWERSVAQAKKTDANIDAIQVMIRNQERYIKHLTKLIETDKSWKKDRMFACSQLSVLNFAAERLADEMYKARKRNVDRFNNFEPTSEPTATVFTATIPA